jgi:hypothetical protein
MKKIMVSAMVATATLAASAFAGEMTKYDSDDTVGVTSSVTFPAHSSPNRIIGLLSKTGTSTGYITIFARENVTNNPAVVTNTVAISGTNVGVAVTSAFTAGDRVAIQYADGTVSNDTVGFVTAGSIVSLTTPLVKALAAGDKIYKLSQQGSIYTAATALNLAGDALFVSPTDSPLWVNLVGTNANYLTVTTQW